MTRVVVLGGGPAGLGAAYQLHRQGKAEAVVLERAPAVGGNAGSFAWNGHRLDFGSHRLHPACDPEVLGDVQELLGPELLDRPRHGRIRLLGRWIHFPLKPVDLLVHLPPRFGLGAGFDAVRKMLPRADLPESEANFATVLERSLGPTICREFYFPYALKIWGHDPSALSAIQARRRVSASSFGKLLKKVLSSVPGLKPPGAGRFYYPQQGFGRISEAYAAWRVTTENGSAGTTIEGDLVWSTIPVTLLVRMLRPAAPEHVLAATRAISYRAMTLVYLELDVDHFTEFDAHYFPGADVRMTRLSEPKNYGVRTEPAGRTVICAEVPCAVGDDVWDAADDDLGRMVADDLARSDLPLARPPAAVHVRRLPQAYPVYLTGYEEPFGVLDEYASSIDGLLSYGRQGLFAHDNTHHALHMAYAAVDSLRDGAIDPQRWAEHRAVFATHVVED
jgi:protoporphyrinogen oxidase